MASIIKKAIDQLQLTLKPEDARFFRDTTLEDLWKEARAIEHEQGQRLDLRFMRRLEPFLETMESYSKLAKQYHAVMEKVLQAYSDIAEVLPRIDKLKAAFGDKADFKEMLGLVYGDILEFHQRAYRMFRRKGWHIWFMFDWGLFERRFKSTIQSLASHCDLLDREAAATYFLEAKAVWEKRKVEEKSYEDQIKTQFTRETLGWLSAEEDSQEEFLHRLSDQRHVGTCDWILEEPDVAVWMEDNESNATVWVTGIPGSGKSHCCSLIAQNSELHLNRSTLYFFCGSRPFNPKDAPTLVLRTLAVQLLRQNLELAPLIHRSYLQKGLGPSGPTIKKVLKDLFISVTTMRIVLDGIDEWDQLAQRETLKTLVELQKHGGDQCKLLVSSRKEPLIAKCLPQKLHIHITHQSTAGLNCYIHSCTEDLRDRFADFAPSMFERLKRNLMDRANGMFLWVRLVQRMLADSSSEREFDSAIDQLPDGLDEAYGRILSRLGTLSPILRERALRVLYWTCASYRSVSIDEVTDGIALKPGQTELCAKNRSQNPDRDILELCAPMLERSERGALDLVHFSAKEYLINHQSGPFVERSEAHFHLAFSCVVNLTSSLILVPSFSQQAEMDIERAVVAGTYGLHSYANQYWGDHVASYLSCVQGSHAESFHLLIQALEDLSKVVKGRASTSVVPSASLPPSHCVHGIEKLHAAPGPSLLLSLWTDFKAKLTAIASTFETLDAQNEWMLMQDKTYFSLIEQRLRAVTERLMNMDRSSLPSHIRVSDHDAFVTRYGFSCRVHGCTQSFKSGQERNSHETSHTTSFICLQCDFSGRGFTSKEALRKHTQRYHMSPDDFAVPDSLRMCQVEPKSADRLGRGSSSRCSRISQSWSEQGQRASQHSFQQMLSAVESSLSAAVLDNRTQHGHDNNGVMAASSRLSSPHKDADAAIPDFESIREGIEDHRYSSLSHFKHDLQEHLLCAQSSETLEISSKVDLICNDELEKVITGFPGFATVDRDLPWVSAGPQSSEKAVADHDANFNHVSRVTDLAVVGSRKTYWSVAEEKELPELLNRYGRDLIKIAACLKTKTLEEIGLHLPNSEETQRVELPADDANLEKPVSPEPSPAHGLEAETTSLYPHATSISSLQGKHLLGADAVAWPPRYTARLNREDEPADSGTQDSLQQHHSGEGLDEKTQAAGPPRRAPRKSRGRRSCKLCKKDFDFYGIERHVLRCHTPTRKMWVCNDGSMTRTFFSPCKSCRRDKSYASKHNAMKHLRECHFPSSTSEQTLLRWVEPTEEPNPKYKDPNSSGTDHRNPRSTSSGPQKRRKLEPVASIWQLPEPNDVENRLPSMRLTPMTLSHKSTPESSASVHDSDINDENPKLLGEMGLVSGISFDNLLPLVPMDASTNTNGNASSTGQQAAAYIRPDQVHRLPHLNDYQKRLCLDQVKALYSLLSSDQDVRNHPARAWADRELHLLSRTLLSGLRDWRKRSTYTPSLTFSI
ncbi:MAG: hypothetical protein Q9218_001671 [Villophora microphyllina]